MSHFVKDWMSTPVLVIDADSSVAYALTLMRRRNVHSLVVNLGGEHPSYGIITTTDIRDKILAPGRNPANTSVRDIMTVPILTARPNWTLIECSQKMQTANIHHLPVVDQDNSLVGIISTTDLFIAVEEIGWDDIFQK